MPPTTQYLFYYEHKCQHHCCHLVKVPGVEPGLIEPKSIVLPLHHTSITRSTIWRTLHVVRVRVGCRLFRIFLAVVLGKERKDCLDTSGCKFLLGFCIARVVTNSSHQKRINKYEDGNNNTKYNIHNTQFKPCGAGRYRPGVFQYANTNLISDRIADLSLSWDEGCTSSTHLHHLH